MAGCVGLGSGRPEYPYKLAVYSPVESQGSRFQVVGAQTLGARPVPFKVDQAMPIELALGRRTIQSVNHTRE